MSSVFSYVRATSVLPHPLSTNGTVLISSEKVEYLGLFLKYNLPLGAHVELTYTMKRVHSAGAPRDKLVFIDALTSPLILYCYFSCTPKTRFRRS